MKTVIFEVELNEAEAFQLAQMLKRISHRDCRSLSENEAQAYLMMSACGQVREALSRVGFNPR